MAVRNSSIISQRLLRWIIRSRMSWTVIVYIIVRYYAIIPTRWDFDFILYIPDQSLLRPQFVDCLFTRGYLPIQIHTKPMLLVAYYSYRWLLCPCMACAGNSDIPRLVYSLMFPFSWSWMTYTARQCTRSTGRAGVYYRSCSSGSFCSASSLLSWHYLLVTKLIREMLVTSCIDLVGSTRSGAVDIPLFNQMRVWSRI